MIKKQGFYLGLLWIILFLIITMVPDSNKGYLGIFSANIIIVFSILFIRKRIFEHIPFVLFNITFFTFILGGCTFAFFEGIRIEQYASVYLTVSDANTASLLAFIGISIIDIIYLATTGVGTQLPEETAMEEQVGVLPNKSSRIIVDTIFAITFVCKFAMAFEKMAAASALGYVALYTREGSSLPTIVTFVGSLFYFSMMLFLSSYPGKRITYASLVGISIIEAMIINSGDRGEPVCVILAIIVYIIQRCKIQDDFLVHKKSSIFGLILMAPVGMYFLQAIKYVRLGNEMELGITEAIIEFFKSQGVSFNILAITCSLHEQLNTTNFSSFIVGQLWGYLTQNVFVRTLFGIPLIKGNTVEMAMSGFSLGSTISYNISPTSYLNGIGAGTSYLAELFIDASWFGVICGSVVIVILLQKLRNMTSMSWIKHAIYLNILRCVLSMPRGEFFKWLTEAFSIPNLMLLFLILFISSASKQKTKV